MSTYFSRQNYNRYLETSAPTEDEIAQRNTDVLVDDLTVSPGRVIVPKDFHGTDDSDTGGIRGDKDNTLLVVRAFVIRVALPHNDVQLGARVTGAADPPVQSINTGRKAKDGELRPFSPVNDNFVAFSADRSPDVGRV